MDEHKNLLLMYGWIALAVLNLVLIAIAFIRFAQ